MYILIVIIIISNFLFLFLGLYLRVGWPVIGKYLEEKGGEVRGKIGKPDGKVYRPTDKDNLNKFINSL